MNTVESLGYLKGLLEGLDFDGQVMTNEEIDMVKIDGEWYISGEGLF